MQTSDDEQHLRLLSIFHYIVAGITGLIFCFPIIHFVVGVGMVIASLTQPRETGFIALPGLFFVLIAGSIMLMGWMLAICMALTDCVNPYGS